MEAVAHSPAFAKKVGVPKSVGEDFSQADKGRKFGKGGGMKKYAGGGDITVNEYQEPLVKGMKKGGNVANTSRMNRLEELGRVNAEKAFTPKGKENLAEEKKRVVGELKKYAKGGMAESKAMVGKEVAFMKKKGAPAAMIKHEKAEMGMKKGGGVKKMAAGGSASKRADGVAKQGKTKGKMLNKGGMAC
jgi:hypothetical protein